LAILAILAIWEIIDISLGINNAGDGDDENYAILQGLYLSGSKIVE
jgi:hypothetical protein